MSDDLRELDLQIAEQVFGRDRLTARVDPMNRNGEPQYYWGYPVGHDFAPFYSTDIKAAMEVVEKLQLDGWELSLYTQEGLWVVAVRPNPFQREESEFHAHALLLSEAICRAALQALNSDVKQQE